MQKQAGHISHFNQRKADRQARHSTYGPRIYHPIGYHSRHRLRGWGYLKRVPHPPLHPFVRKFSLYLLNSHAYIHTPILTTLPMDQWTGQSGWRITGTRAHWSDATCVRTRARTRTEKKLEFLKLCMFRQNTVFACLSLECVRSGELYGVHAGEVMLGMLEQNALCGRMGERLRQKKSSHTKTAKFSSNNTFAATAAGSTLRWRFIRHGELNRLLKKEKKKMHGLYLRNV